MFKILFTAEASEQMSLVHRRDPKSARIILDHIYKLPVTYQNDPFLKGELFRGLRRNRIGKYRTLYRVLEEEREIRIIDIDLRRSVYE